jgi:hypothetical protein
MFAATKVKAVATAIRRIVPSFLRIRVTTVGTMDTSGAHWWHDPTELDSQAFCRVVQRAAASAFQQAHLLLFRDVLDSDPGAVSVARLLEHIGYRRAKGLPIAWVRTRASSELHYNSLNRKVRAFIRKMPLLANEHGLRLAVADHPLDYLEEAYQLFLNVAERAQELQREPIPLEFFRQLLQLPGCRMRTAHGPSGRLVGFILTRTAQEIACPAYIGLDYRVGDGARLYHQLLWAEIAACLEEGAKEVDLGLTSYFVKQGFGAVLDGSLIMARFRQDTVNRVLGWLIPFLLRVEQPSVRRKTGSSTSVTDLSQGGLESASRSDRRKVAQEEFEDAC